MFGKHDIQNIVIRYVLPFIGCVLAAVATVHIMSQVNPLAAALFCASAVFCAIAIVTPRVGLIILFVLCAYSDLLKRLLIFWSELTFEQISYVLAAAPLVVAGLVLAVITRWAFHTIQIHRRDVLMGIFVVAAMGLSFLLDWKTSHEFLSGAKAAVNSGLYVAMMPIAATFVTSQEQLVKLFRTGVFIFIPVAIYGVIQAIFGFANFELQYLATGLSSITFEGVPRPFSTLNSAGALGDMSAIMGMLALIPYIAKEERELPLKPLLFPFAFIVVYILFCIVGDIRFSVVVAAVGSLLLTLPFVIILGEGKQIVDRLVPIALFLIFAAGCVSSLVRHSYFLLLASIVGVFSFRSASSTRVFYIVGVALALSLVLSASYLLQHLAAWDPASTANNEFSERALSIQTYAERLKGFSNLTSSLDMYSAFGLPNEQKSTATTYHHDPISGILVDYGLFALIAVVTGFVWMVRFAHRSVLSLPAGQSRLLGVLILSIMIAILASHVLFYGVLTTFPVNAFFWFFAGCLFSLIARAGEEVSKAIPPVDTPATQPRWSIPVEFARQPVSTGRAPRQRSS